MSILIHFELRIKWLDSLPSEIQSVGSALVQGRTCSDLDGSPPTGLKMLDLLGLQCIPKSSAAKSLLFIRAYSYIRVFEEKYSYFTRIFVIYSYFLWFRAHSTRCQLFEPVKLYLINLWLQIHGKVLQYWNNQKTCWILNCIGVLWTLNCIGVPIYALLS